MIVPVYVSHVETPNREVLVYALLDNQSSTSFILDSTRDKLGVSGPTVTLSLSTMFAEHKPIQSARVSGLVVRAVDSNTRIPLPSLYSRNIMPADKSHIPTREMALDWPHL